MKLSFTPHILEIGQGSPLFHNLLEFCLPFQLLDLLPRLRSFALSGGSLLPWYYSERKRY
jgi:hypothetical protein